ncbi:MAG: ADP-ribosylglycohydrolase family protein [Herpetosiphon sp.]|nr:ADP-ribosylglycohydrolase family protein [Herpetosiphon sp.]
MFHSAQEYINHGWVECLQVLDRVTLAMQEPDRQIDPCLQTGAGWIAEEAFATGLLCFLLFPDEPQKAVQRAAVSSGDSDRLPV